MTFKGEGCFGAVLESNVQCGLDEMGDEFLCFVAGLVLWEFDFKGSAVFEVDLYSVINFVFEGPLYFVDESDR